MVFRKYNLIDSDGNMLPVDYLIEVYNTISGLNNITLRKGNVYGFNKMYIDKDVIDYNLHQIINQFNERKTTPVKYYQYC